jgi:hypothetical protein
MHEKTELPKKLRLKMASQSSCQRQESNGIIFCRDMCVAENTSRLANVEIGSSPVSQFMRCSKPQSSAEKAHAFFADREEAP